MPCPFFEPRFILETPTHVNARLPLVEEYDGRCWAGAESVPVPEELRFRYCNHGYSSEVCSSSRAEGRASAVRFSVLEQTASCIEILCVTELNFAPIKTARMRYSIAAQLFDEPVTEPCLQEQAKAFCRSYLRRTGPR